LKYGLNITAEGNLRHTIEKGVEGERLGFNFIWVFDRPAERYGPVVASALASNTERIRIGLGISPLLHPPQQISSAILTLIKAHGERFDLCLIPGDKHQLQRVGVDHATTKNIPQYLLQVKNRVEEELAREKLRCRIWVGAQGPKMLRTALHYGGVHLNYASPRMISWALEQIGSAGERGALEISVIPPSYVYVNFDEKIHRILRLAASLVAFGAPREALEAAGLYERLADLRGLKGKPSKSDLESVSSEVVSEFSVSMPSESLSNYVASIQRLGIAHLVFSYPQDYSLETIRELAKSLPLKLGDT